MENASGRSGENWQLADLTNSYTEADGDSNLKKTRHELKVATLLTLEASLVCIECWQTNTKVDTQVWIVK